MHQGHAAGMDRKILDAGAKLQADLGARPYCVQERTMKIATVNHPVGHAVTELGCLTQRQSDQLVRGRSRKHPDGLGRECNRGEG